MGDALPHVAGARRLPALASFRWRLMVGLSVISQMATLAAVPAA
jgi:hypothetical protein